MKTYILPQISFSLETQDDITNVNVNQTLFTTINNKKSFIDSVQHKWSSAKKVSNDYEYIYTSSNYKRNISSIIPVSRSFFKLREIIYDYRLNTSGKHSCIAEAPGGFIQSLLKHTEEKKISLDCIYGITLISDDKEIPFWNPTLINHPKVTISNGKDNTGDLYKLTNVVDYIKTCGRESCQIVTADGGFDYTTDFEQELSSYKLFYSEIMIAINIQKKGGVFICKLFDLFWYSTLQLLYILYLSYEKISFTKPSTSRQSNSEKYIVCQGFKGYNKEYSNLLCSYFNKDILPIQLPTKFIEIINEYHTQFINYQIQRINNTLKLINERRILDKPSRQQIRLAMQWCQKYSIPVNKSCIYV
jgi:23S rRNA U2552 (ribose-2'-O)-methylase RlmE/FtsJ